MLFFVHLGPLTDLLEEDGEIPGESRGNSGRRRQDWAFLPRPKTPGSTSSSESYVVSTCHKYHLISALTLFGIFWFLSFLPTHSLISFASTFFFASIFFASFLKSNFLPLEVAIQSEFKCLIFFSLIKKIAYFSMGFKHNFFADRGCFFKCKS